MSKSTKEYNSRQSDFNSGPKNQIPPIVQKQDDLQTIDMDALLLNLKIISSIQENNKLKTCGTTDLKIDQDYLSGLFRWMHCEGREATIQRISFIIKKVFILIQNIIDNKKKENNSQDNQKLHRLLIGLTASLKGLENLKITYKNDINIKSKLNLLMENIELKINQLKEMFKISSQ